MKEIKIGLIGLGFMGTTHLGIYRQLPGVKVAGIADVDPAKRAGDVSKVVGNIGDGSGNTIDMTGIKVYEDAFDMIAEADFDIIDICVPTPDHSKYAIAALKAGKNVFCEKPVCRNIEQMVELREAVKDAKGFFNVGMCVRAWPEYNHAKELIASGAVGKVKSALFRRLSPSVDGNAWENWYMTEERSGGAVLDLHLHDTDFVCHLFGRPDAVQSAGIRGLVSDNGIDHLITSYVYPDGKLVTCEGGWGAAKGVPFEMSFQIICEKATIKLDAAGYNIYNTDGSVTAPVIDCADLPTGWHQELNYFVNCVRDNVKPDRYQTPDSIFEAFQVVMAEMESVDNGKTVEIKYV